MLRVRVRLSLPEAKTFPCLLFLCCIGAHTTFPSFDGGWKQILFGGDLKRRVWERRPPFRTYQVPWARRGEMGTSGLPFTQKRANVWTHICPLFLHPGYNCLQLRIHLKRNEVIEHMLTSFSPTGVPENRAILRAKKCSPFLSIHGHKVWLSRLENGWKKSGN